jgi:hypothetical protein
LEDVGGRSIERRESAIEKTPASEGGRYKVKGTKPFLRQGELKTLRYNSEVNYGRVMRAACARGGLGGRKGWRGRG